MLQQLRYLAATALLSIDLVHGDGQFDPSWGPLPPDDLGEASGYIKLNTTNFDFQIVHDAQILVSLKPAGSDFDYLPFDCLDGRRGNGQNHWGDIHFRYRQAGSSDDWTGQISSSARQPVDALEADGQVVLAASCMRPTLPAGPLNITREWIEVDGDLGLQFTVLNSDSSAIEIGSLGFPAEFASIFSRFTPDTIQDECVLSEPYIGMHAGHIRVVPVRLSNAPALLVTPLNDNTPLEAYYNLWEENDNLTFYGRESFEGFYEWQALSKAFADKEWAQAEPWNPPSSRTLQPGESAKFGVRFSLVPNGVRDFDTVLESLGVPVAQGVPGYIIPRGEPATLLLQHNGTAVSSISSAPDGALSATLVSDGRYTVTASDSAWGRARLTITYDDGKIQTVHYYITKPGTEAVADLGNFLTTAQYYTDTSDPFGRAPSVMTYDHEAQSIVLQEDRVWIAGLSDEGGAGSYLAAFMKQVLQPDAKQVEKLEAFVDGVLWKTIEQPDFSVRKSIFYYDPDAMPNYPYSPSFDWTKWSAWDKTAAYSVVRAYNYVHVAASYWAMYRVGRAYPGLLKTHNWDWYLGMAHVTVMRMMGSDVGYTFCGLMGETVFGEILQDMVREQWVGRSDEFRAAMLDRAYFWGNLSVPYGSEMSWDSTGQEGVYYWTKFFNMTDLEQRTVDSVLAYVPTVPHWGWNGNARRYWDFKYAGKIQRIERMIHHYGSALNGQVLLSAFRSNPADTYLVRTGFGGISGPMSNIHQDGFPSVAFHSFPDTLKWDAYSGDYGCGFLGLVLNSGTYIAQDPILGLVAYGGTLEMSGDDNDIVTVRTTDPTRRKVFIGSLGLHIHVDAGIISEVSYTQTPGPQAGPPTISVTLSQLEGVAMAVAANVWVEVTMATGVAASGYEVLVASSSGIELSRGGWLVPLDGTNDVAIEVGPV